MDLSRLTQKSQEALTAAQNKAVTFGHQQVDCEHMLAALVEQEDGLIARLCQKIGAPREGVVNALEEELRKLPSMTGPGFEAGKIYLSQKLSQVLVDAEKHAKRMKDEYVSVEHVVLALLDTGAGTPAVRVLERFGVTEETFLACASGRSRQPARAEREPGGDLRSAATLRRRSRAGRAHRQARSDHRSRRGDPPRRAHPQPQDEETIPS